MAAIAGDTSGAISSVAGAPNALIPISDGLFRKKSMRINIMITPNTPIAQKVARHSTELIKKLTTIAKTAGPKP